MLWSLAGGALALALLAAWRERARVRRHDLNRVAWVDWRSVQFAAILAVLVLAGLALHLQ
jgi:hypothetical protein